MSDLFLVTIRAERVQENGASANVTEQYLIKADSFTAAEDVAMAEAAGDTEAEILRITRPKLAGVFGVEGAGEKFYRVKIAITTLDEKTGADKKSTQAYLVRENTMEEAMREFKAAMRGTMSDWEFASVSETKIVDYYETQIITGE